MANPVTWFEVVVTDPEGHLVGVVKGQDGSS